MAKFEFIVLTGAKPAKPDEILADFLIRQLRTQHFRNGVLLQPQCRPIATNDKQ